jgi:hypothetical protein
MQWRMAGDPITTLPAGTMVEVLDREDGWFWVMLPPDQNGTHRVGWIEENRLEPGSGLAAPPMRLEPSSHEVNDDGGARHDGPGPASARGPRWHAQAVGGLTFGTETSRLFGGSIGYAWSRNVSVTAEMGRVADITSESMRDSMAAVVRSTTQMLSTVTGRAFDVVGETKMPAFYGLAGLKYTAPRMSRARPFVSGHTGFASVDPTVRLLINGDDRSTSFLPPASVPPSRTRLLLGGGTGLTVRVTKALSVDVGYRYSHIFVDDGVHLNRVYAAVGFAF